MSAVIPQDAAELAEHHIDPCAVRLSKRRTPEVLFVGGVQPFQHAAGVGGQNLPVRKDAEVTGAGRGERAGLICRMRWLEMKYLPSKRWFARRGRKCMRMAKESWAKQCLAATLIEQTQRAGARRAAGKERSHPGR